MVSFLQSSQKLIWTFPSPPEGGFLLLPQKMLTLVLLLLQQCVLEVLLEGGFLFLQVEVPHLQQILWPFEGKSELSGLLT